MKWINKQQLSKREVAQILEDFIENRGDPWAWDDFISAAKLENGELEAIRRRCAGLSAEFPSEKQGEYCNENGREIIRSFVSQLKASEH